MSKTRIIFFLLIGLIGIWIIFPKRRFLQSPTGNGKCITIYHPVGSFLNNRIYVIPKKYKGIFKPINNYVIIQPAYDQVLNVNWEPNDGYVIKIELPLCNQPFINTFDSSKYKIFRGCGPSSSYIDKEDTFYFPKYSSYTNWMR